MFQKLNPKWIKLGTDVATINKLLKQFKMMSEMMKKMSKGNMKGMADKGIPPELFNQLK